jgi:hypothetical protein
MGKLFGWITGRKACSDAKRIMMVLPRMTPVQAPTDDYVLLMNQLRKLIWCVHQSKPVKRGEKYCWDDCPRKKLNKAKRPCSSETHICCEECGTYLGKDVFLHNSFVNGVLLNCHRHYHLYLHNKEFAPIMVIN